jgi:hypothetical protein
VQARIKPDPGNQEIARIGNLSERFAGSMFRLLMEPD